MSQQTDQDKASWGNRPVSKRDLILLGGIVTMLVVAAVGILTYAIWNPPPEKPVAETSTTTQPGSETAQAADMTIQYPPLAVLPAVSYPRDNPFSEEKSELGKMLYFDTRMSGDGSLSCNSCHPASDGSWGVSSAISFGYPGSTHWRNASTIINVAYYSKLNWDGGKTSIEKQNNGAWGGAVAGNVDSAMAEERLAQMPEYTERFKTVFGTDYPLYSDALKAVATFQRTIVSQNVPFDAFLAGDENAITAEAKQGYELFAGKANCIACHNGPLISDDTYHNLGVPTYPGFETNNLNQITFRYEHWAKGVTDEDYATATEDMGLYYVTKLNSDIGKFRTPGLRDVCYTAPYMHNGSFNTLVDVVAFYNEGGGDHANRDPLLQPLNLSAGELSTLVAFLESLCGDKIVVEQPQLPSFEAWSVASETGGS